MKGWKKIFHANRDQKKAGVAILISDKIDFKTKAVKRDKEGYYINIKRSADKWVRKLWYICTMEYYSAIKKNTFESVLMRWMKLEPIQSEVSQKEKHEYSILTRIYRI